MLNLDDYKKRKVKKEKVQELLNPEDVLTEEEKVILDQNVAEVIKKVSKFEKQDIVDKLNKLFEVKLRNEFFVSESIKLGVENDLYDLETAIGLMRSSKDSLNSLGTILRLFEEKSTSNEKVDTTIKVNEVDITERTEQLLNNRTKSQKALEN